MFLVLTHFNQVQPVFHRTDPCLWSHWVLPMVGGGSAVRIMVLYYHEMSELPWRMSHVSIWGCVFGKTPFRFMLFSQITLFNVSVSLMWAFTNTVCKGKKLAFFMHSSVCVFVSAYQSLSLPGHVRLSRSRREADCTKSCLCHSLPLCCIASIITHNPE